MLKDHTFLLNIYYNLTIVSCFDILLCAELLATFRDNILKKGRSEKLSDKVIKETLVKVIFLLFIIHLKFI